MRTSARRIVAVVLSAGVLTLAGAGIASADTRGGNATANSEVVQTQGNDTDQSNTNVAPVTQVNPAANVNILGLGDQSTDQDNSVDSRNNQDNSNTTVQDQEAVASAAADADADAEKSHSRDTEATSVVDQLLVNDTDQDNTNVAPVTQVNPAANVNILGDGDQSTDQDNSVDSRNDQDNSNRTSLTQVGESLISVLGG